MVFSSPYFILIFLPITLSGYFLLNKFSKLPVIKIWVLIASSFFYGYSSSTHLILIYGSIIINYLVGKGIENSISRKRKNGFLFTGILLNITLLIYFKYTLFLISTINNFTLINIPFSSIVLPLAISFYCFQQISFLADCYNNQVKVSGRRLQRAR